MYILAIYSNYIFTVISTTCRPRGIGVQVFENTFPVVDWAADGSSRKSFPADKTQVKSFACVGTDPVIDDGKEKPTITLHLFYFSIQAAIN